MVAIVDYGMGNLRSVEKAFLRLNVNVKITSSTDEIDKASKIVLPGVGNFKRGMENLQQRGLIEILNKKVLEDYTPILGICLGMQLFTTHSEEGNVNGLNWINAQTKRFKFDDPSLKIPHIGWNSATVIKDNPLFSKVENNESYYFVHSFYVQCEDKSHQIATTHYGIDFDSSIGKNNIIGTQFHPEKSHDDGMQLIKNFIDFY